MTNKSTASTNLLPIFIIVGLIVVAGFLLTKDDIKAPWQNNGRIKAEHLTNFPREVPTLEELDKERLVIKSQQQLDDLLLKIDPTGSTKVAEKINFDKDIVLVATTETQTTDGFSLKIAKIYKNDEDMRFDVMVSVIKPGETCDVQQVSNVVVDMVKIKKTDLPINFEKEERDEECGDKPKSEESTPSEETTNEDSSEITQ